MPEAWLAMSTTLVPLRALMARLIAPCLQLATRGRASPPFASGRWPTLLACFLTFSVCSRAFGAVQGFDESFDGNGSYATESGSLSGLDNPGWRLDTNEGIGVLDGTGYSFAVGVYPADSDWLWRTVPGIDSFREVVRVSGLDLGVYSQGGIGEGGPRSQVALRHYFPGGGFQSSLAVYFSDPPGGAENNAVYWGGAEFSRIVPRFEDFELGLEYDYLRKTVTYWLDSAETGRLFAAPIDVRVGSNPGFTETGLYLSKTMDGKLNGRIDNWSVEPLPRIRADINDDGMLNTADVDLLSLIIRRNGADAVADLSIDGKVDQTDLGLWIHDHRKSYFGDANLDGQFTSQDLTLVFQAGQYEDTIEDNSTWATGDWNADAEFTSSDLVLAFQDGGYEKRPRPASSVPEPNAFVLLAILLATSSRVHAFRALRGPRPSSAPIAIHRGQFQRTPVLVAGFFMLLSCRMALGAVEGFDESFDGTGPYATTSQNLSGLDNPNWKFTTDVEPGQLDGEGYLFEHSSFPNNGSGWMRNLVRNGSYRQSVKLSDLEMGWSDPAPFLEPGWTSGIRLDGAGFGSSLTLIYDPLRPEGERVLDWGFSTFTGGATHDLVPLSSDLEVGLEVDFEHLVAWAWVDSPATGRIVRGPLPFTSIDNPAFINIRFGAAAIGPSYISGRLDNWSLEPLPDIRADINDDGVLNTADVDLLSLIIRRNGADAVADLSIDGTVDQTDLGLWIHDHRKSYFGDANLDGQFSSQDLTLVFQAGEYEDTIEDNSTWATGDWNADGEFSSSDLVVAFQDGGYEKGPRPAEGVPEPGGMLRAFGGLVSLCSRRFARAVSRQRH